MNIKSVWKGKNRYIAAGVVAAALGGGAFAFAASLNPTSSTLGAGSTSVGVPGCTPAASYTTAWDNTLFQFDVATVVVTGSSGCAGDSVSATLQSTNGGAAVNTTNGSGVLTGGSFTSGNSYTYTWTLNGAPAVAASAVNGISTVVTGSN